MYTETDKVVGLIDLTKHAGWYLPHRDICWVSERHHILNRDERGRLHSLSGPAVMYPDGWAIYAVHGVRLPEYIVERPQEINPAKIDSEPNAEIRRVMIERYGQSRYLLDSGAKEIHRDNLGTLYRKELANDEPIVMVKVTNSTPEPDGSHKDYFLRVPPDIDDASAAIAWTFGMRKRDYKPLAET